MRQTQTLVRLALLSTLVLVFFTNGKGQNPPQEDEFAITIEGICTFPVLIEIAGKVKFIELSGGRTIIVSPRSFVTLTNLDEPSKQEVMPITGAFHETISPNGDIESVVTGRNLLVGFDPDALFVVTVGDFSFVFDENSNLIQPVTGNGRMIDICTLLE